MQTQANEGFHMQSRAGLTALVLGDAVTVGLLRPHFGALAARLAHPRAWVQAAGLDGALVQVAGAALWLAAAWLATGVLVGLAGRLPGAAGAAARALAHRLLPGALYRLAAGSAGLGVLLSPVAAHAVPAAHPGPAGTSQLPTPTWPGSASAGSSAPIPAPTWPGSAAADPQPTPPHRAEPPAGATARHVIVRPGDSLWGIAARHLDAPARPARIAQAWPRWYAANRAVVGPDPSLIRPGQLLRPPEAGQ
jgi:nucleoid-associated protein YgaU